MKDKSVLITDISSYKAICIARFVKENYPDILIYGTDNRALSQSIHTKYIDQYLHISASGQDNDYASQLAKWTCSKNIDLLIPVNSKEMAPILTNRNQFSGALDYWGDLSSYETLNNKLKLADLAQTLGLRTPKPFQNLDSVRLPAVAKPRESSSSKGVFYLKNENDIVSLRKWFDTNSLQNQYVFQEFVQGFGAGYSVYTESGTILQEYGHKRICEFPVSGGSSVYREGFFHPEMKVFAEALLTHTNWSGFAMFEFKVSHDGVYLIEVNPRIWGSINQGLQEGVNYFAPLLGPTKSLMKAKTPTRTYFSPLVYLSFLVQLIHLDFKGLGNFLLNFKINKSDISFFRDPLGYLSFFNRVI
jgi:predicted ATP-grasp superfamily ATP-dependent carboligase